MLYYTLMYIIDYYACVMRVMSHINIIVVVEDTLGHHIICLIICIQNLLTNVILRTLITTLCD